MRRRTLASAIGAAALLLIVVGGAGYLYYFSGLRAAPKPLALATASPLPAATAGADEGLDGTWKVTSGSIVRYRVNEVFAGTTSNHQAVAETGDVSGNAGVQGSSGAAGVSELKVTARLSSLHSIDTVAGFNVAQRDRIVRQALSTSEYPDATFEAQGFQLPAGAASGSPVTLTVPGQLTIRGVTRPERITVKQLQVTGSTARAVGQTVFNMTDFGVQPPALPITSVQPEVTLEFELALAKS